MLLWKGSGIYNIIVAASNMNLVGGTKINFYFIKKELRFLKSSGFSGSLVSIIPCYNEQSQNVSEPYHNSCYCGYSLLECIEYMVSALEHQEELLGTMSFGQNNIHRTKIKQGTITLGEDIIVWALSDQRSKLWLFQQSQVFK